MDGEQIRVRAFGEDKSVIPTAEIPSFDLQRHHAKIKVPENFDLRDLARKLQIFPLKLISIQGKLRLLLAMKNPRDQQAIMSVEMRTGMPVIPVQAEATDIQWLIQKHYYGRPLTPRPSYRPKDLSHQLFESLVLEPVVDKGPEHLSAR